MSEAKQDLVNDHKFHKGSVKNYKRLGLSSSETGICGGFLGGVGLIVLGEGLARGKPLEGILGAAVMTLGGVVIKDSHSSLEKELDVMTEEQAKVTTIEQRLSQRASD